MIISRNLKQGLIFIIIVIGLSYLIFWGPLALFRFRAANLVEGRIDNPVVFIIFLLGGFVPSITGLIMTRIYDGKQGLKELLKSSVNFRIGFLSYLIIVIVPVLVGLYQLLILSLLDVYIDLSQFIKQLPSIVPLILFGPLSEEFGWRGFLQKRLNSDFTPFTSSLIIGIGWSLWHLPLFYISGTSQNEFSIPFISFMVSIISSSFIYTYLYNISKGSLFAAILLHWTGTYILQVITSEAYRTPLYNWLGFVPALVIGFVFVFLIQLKWIQKSILTGEIKQLSAC